MVIETGLYSYCRNIRKENEEGDKKSKGLGLYHAKDDRSFLADIDSFRTSVPLHDFKIDIIAVTQGNSFLEPGDVHEILSAVFASDEAKSFHVVEKLDSSFHCSASISFMYFVTFL